MNNMNYTEIINSRIKEINIVGEPKELYEPISYILNLKSKRIRPILSILSFSLFDNNIKKIISIIFHKINRICFNKYFKFN